MVEEWISKQWQADRKMQAIMGRVSESGSSRTRIMDKVSPASARVLSYYYCCGKERPTQTSRAAVARHDDAPRRRKRHEIPAIPHKARPESGLFAGRCVRLNAGCAFQVPKGQHLLVPRIKNVLAPLGCMSWPYAGGADLRLPEIDNTADLTCNGSGRFVSSCLRVFTGSLMWYQYIRVTV